MSHEVEPARETLLEILHELLILRDQAEWPDIAEIRHRAENGVSLLQVAWDQLGFDRPLWEDYERERGKLDRFEGP